MYEKEDANLNTATLKSSTETLRLPFPCPAFSCCAIMLFSNTELACESKRYGTKNEEHPVEKFTSAKEVMFLVAFACMS